MKYVHCLIFILLQTIHVHEENYSDSYHVSSENYDSDADPPYGMFAVPRCKKKIWIACPRCQILLCWGHTMVETENCRNRGKSDIRTNNVEENEQVPNN